MKSTKIVDILKSANVSLWKIDIGIIIIFHVILMIIYEIFMSSKHNGIQMHFKKIRVNIKTVVIIC